MFKTFFLSQYTRLTDTLSLVPERSTSWHHFNGLKSNMTLPYARSISTPNQKPRELGSTWQLCLVRYLI